MKLTVKPLSYLDELLGNKEEHNIKSSTAFIAIPFNYKDSKTKESINCELKDASGSVRFTIKKNQHAFKLFQEKEGEKIIFYNLWKVSKFGNNTWVSMGQYGELSTLDNKDIELIYEEVTKPEPKKSYPEVAEYEPPPPPEPDEIPVTQPTAAEIKKDLKLEKPAIVENQNRIMRISLGLRGKYQIPGFEEFEINYAVSMDLPLEDHINSTFLVKEKLHQDTINLYLSMCKNYDEIYEKELKKKKEKP